ncbi:MAG: kinase anchor protein [Halolamina sp.]|uniref:kinase anchor protein n=1 Tax=Halolamina sp. TaxID=1940283 RepID=UPI002FC2D0D4
MSEDSTASEKPEAHIDSSATDPPGTATDAIDEELTTTELDSDEGAGVDPERYISTADAELAEQFDETLTFHEYVERIFEHPVAAAHSTKYLLHAIEAMGTRTVIEEGEEKTRYRFFDDPYNDGEHAVLGNTEILNQFVQDLKAIASNRGKQESIIWFEGPTATGKSELKRCLINGLHAFSKTPEGRRYTVEWNTTAATGRNRDPLTYGDDSSIGEADWYESPVQAHPLLVLPKAARHDVLGDLNSVDPSPIETTVNGELPPFSREMYETLAEEYRNDDDIFSAITAPEHLRVKNYVVEEGQGIGVLHTEDDGSPKERLVGAWMPGMLRELDSRGRKNSQAFSYDGVLSQGNNLLTVVEDAAKHSDLLENLLNVPDEEHVKLDKGIGMDVDTQLIIISNPDLTVELDQYEDRNDADPLKALKRRLTQYEFRYLLNVSLEAQLLWRELTNSSELWTMQDETEIQTNVRAPLTLDIKATHADRSADKGTDGVVTRELAPHTIQAAALYNVVSRLDSEGLPPQLSIVEKALLYDHGYIHIGDEQLEKEDFDWPDNQADGTAGIPITYTRDVLSTLVSEPSDRYHESLPVEDVVLPRDVLDAMATRLATTPVFSGAEAARFETLLVNVKDRIFEEQEEDVREAILREEGVSRGAVEEYIEHVFAWGTDETIETGTGETDRPDAMTMKLFETEALGRFDTDEYDGTEPSGAVREFRSDEIIVAVNNILWEERGEDFDIEDVDYRDVPALSTAIETNDWSDVRSAFEDLDPAQWDAPKENTQTAQVKAESIRNMQEMFGYSAASAELVSRRVMNEARHLWD